MLENIRKKAPSERYKNNKIGKKKGTYTERRTKKEVEQHERE